MHKIFVYGTLKEGFPNYYLTQDTTNGIMKFYGKALTVDPWPLIIAGRWSTPYLLEAKGKGKPVLGEIFELDDAMLATFDKLESHPHYYQRDYIDLQLLTQHGKDVTKDNLRETCWVYFLRNFKEELLEKTMMENYSGPATEQYVRPKDRDPDERYLAPADVLKVYKPGKYEDIDK